MIRVKTRKVDIKRSERKNKKAVTAAVKAAHVPNSKKNHVTGPRPSGQEKRAIQAEVRSRKAS